ncbi:MAG: low temperature requirement protein A [Ilumatobacteraceae bacterium]
MAERRRLPHLTATRRQGAQVTPLELFFDLVFVLAITQCTALMAHDPSWTTLFQGLAVLGVLWWSWVGYAWLTSVIDPEEGAVRLIIFAAMAAALVASLCVPEAFGDLGLTFAIAYAVLRVAQLGLFWIGSGDDRELRRSIVGLAVGTTLGVGLLVTASFFDGWVQGALWATALLLDVAEPYVFGSQGWRLMPEHFVERHGLIMIIALGESIVAIGVGADHGVDAGVVVAAVIGVAIAAAQWWAYFDVVAIVAGERLAALPPGREQNDMARDAYSYLHFAMVAGIVLVAFGMKTTIAHVGDPLEIVPATALAGGASLYLLAHVAFRFRGMHELSRQRLVVAVALLAVIPLALVVPAELTAAVIATLYSGLIAYEAHHFADARARIRHHTGDQPVA